MGISLDTIDNVLHSISIVDTGGDELAIAADGSIAVTDNGGSLTVDAVDFDIRDLTHVSDSVKVGDGTDFLAVEADGSINVNTAPGSFDSWKVSVASATTSESELVSTPLASRLAILIQNLGSNDVYLREITGVSTANGLELPAKSSFEACLGDGADIFAITGSSTADLRIVEYAA